MTWTEISKNSDALKVALEEALSQKYKKTRENSFINERGEKFSLCTCSDPEDDGDLFYPSDYSGIDQMVQDMTMEIGA